MKNGYLVKYIVDKFYPIGDKEAVAAYPNRLSSKVSALSAAHDLENVKMLRGRRSAFG